MKLDKKVERLIDWVEDPNSTMKVVDYDSNSVTIEGLEPEKYGEFNGYETLNALDGLWKGDMHTDDWIVTNVGPNVVKYTLKAKIKESEEVGPTLADVDRFNKNEELWRQELAYCVDDNSLSKSQLEDFLRIDIDSNIPSEDAEYFVRDINKYLHGNFANIESIEYLENKKWCPVLGLKEVEDEFQFRFEGVTKYSFRDGNVRYIGWGGQDSVDVTDYFLNHRENTDLVSYVLKDDDDNIITPTVNEDVVMLDAVQFLDKEDAIAYAESHPEVCTVAEVYGPDLSLTSDIAWSRIWHQPSLAGLIESKKSIKENKMKKLKEGVILHFDLEDGTHKALPFDSEEDALEYMDSDDFPIGEWVGDYRIEPVQDDDDDDEDYCDYDDDEDWEDEEEYEDEEDEEEGYDEAFYLVQDEHYHDLKREIKDDDGDVYYKSIFFNDQDEAIKYATEHPEVYFVQECFGPDLCDYYEGDFVWKRRELKEKKFTESVVKWTNDAGEATAYELNEQVKKTLREYGYDFGGNESERPGCVPKHFYNRDTAFEGQTVYLCSVKGEFYDEVIIQICDSKVCGMANYTIRSPEGVLWMGQTPREFEEDVHDMTSGYNEF